VLLGQCSALALALGWAWQGLLLLLLLQHHSWSARGGVHGHPQPSSLLFCARAVSNQWLADGACMLRVSAVLCVHCVARRLLPPLEM